MEDRFRVFIDSCEPDESDPLLDKLEREAVALGVPIVKRETLAFLKTQLRLKAPRRVLEVGCGIGYSVLQMAGVLPEAGFVTLELDHGRCERAAYYIGISGQSARISLLEGDAGALLKTLREPFDFIFLDGPKGQYPLYFPELDRLLAPGGVLFADNILREGSLLASRYALPRRQRTIHERLRTYVRMLYGHPGYQNALLPVGDGVLLSVKQHE